MPLYAVNAQVQRISAGFMAPGQAAKQYVGRVAASASVTTTVALETVTTGKTFYVTDLFVASDSPSATAIVDFHLQAAGADIFRTAIHQLSPLESPGIETQPFATSGQAVQIFIPITPGAPNVWYNVLGFEQ